jgi:DNA polymerase-3 subunit epsilon
MIKDLNTVLILDTETTGFDHATESLIEIGAIMFHVPSRSVLAQVSFLLPCDGNEAENINGIPAKISRLCRNPYVASEEMLRSMAEGCDAVVAHNADFDRKWFLKDERWAFLAQMEWLCSCTGFNWPSEKNLGGYPKLQSLALAYGIPVWNAHRALTDCIYLAQVFERCPNLEELLKDAQTPRFLYVADVTYEDKDLAKKAGFRWSVSSKSWTRKLTAEQSVGLPFPVHLV